MWHVNFLATTILVTLAQLTSSAQGFTVENQQEQLCFISDCFVARSPLLQDSVSELDCNSIKVRRVLVYAYSYSFLSSLTQSLVSIACTPRLD